MKTHADKSKKRPTGEPVCTKPRILIVLLNPPEGIESAMTIMHHPGIRFALHDMLELERQLRDLGYRERRDNGTPKDLRTL